MRYLITFTCYGAHLHGDESGSVDRHHNLLGSPRAALKSDQMDHPAYILDPPRRTTVLAALREACSYRVWNLRAAHIRTNHIHVVVESDDPPEKVMQTFKSYATRALNRIEPNHKRWTRHGSTRWLWKDEDVQAAIDYVISKQGNPMEVFLDPSP